MGLQDHILLKLLMKLSGDSWPEDSAEPPISWLTPFILDTVTPIKLVANLSNEAPEVILARLKKLSTDPKLNIAKKLLQKITGATVSGDTLPKEWQESIGVFTPLMMVANILGLSLEQLEDKLAAKSIPEVRGVAKDSEEPATTSDEIDKAHIPWTKTILPASISSVKLKFSVIKEQLQKVILNYIYQHPSSDYNDISQEIWSKHKQLFSDFAHSKAGPHHKYLMQYLIRICLEDEICAIARTIVETAGNNGIKYIDVVKQIQEINEFKTLINVWPLYKNIRFLRNMLKKCFRDVGFQTTGLTASLRWYAKEPAKVEASIEEKIIPVTDCGHPSRCSGCGIKLRCQNCGPASQNLKGDTCIRCSWNLDLPVMMEPQELESVSGEVPSAEAPIIAAPPEIQDIINNIAPDTAKVQDEVKFILEFWQGFHSPPEPESTQCANYSEFVVSYNKDVLDAALEASKNIENFPFQNPYFLNDLDYQWYRVIYEYYLNHKLPVSREDLSNIAKRFETTIHHICETLIRLKIDLEACTDLPLQEIRRVGPRRQYNIIRTALPKTSSKDRVVYILGGEEGRNIPPIIPKAFTVKHFERPDDIPSNLFDKPDLILEFRKFWHRGALDIRGKFNDEAKDFRRALAKQHGVQDFSEIDPVILRKYLYEIREVPLLSGHGWSEVKNEAEKNVAQWDLQWFLDVIMEPNKRK